MIGTKPLFPWRYCILAYLLTWIFWIPIALTRQDYQTSPILLVGLMLGVFGPGMAGIVMTYREQGQEGLRDFWRRIIDVRRIRLPWVAIIIVLFPVFHLISITINHWLGGDPPEFAFIKEATTMPAGILVVVILYLLQAALEELGWRGYMLDRLQAIWKPLTASLLLGFVHALWHAPLFWIVGTNQSRYSSGIDILWFGVFVLSASIFSTWCYNDNHRSTLAVILLHTVANLSLDTFMLPGSGEPIFKIVAAFGAALIALFWSLPKAKLKPMFFSQGRLK